ncbi:MAG: nitrous oxide reductase family maturation protein NosD [Candidatus Hermodarchaeota archaeon]
MNLNVKTSLQILLLVGIFVSCLLIIPINFNHTKGNSSSHSEYDVEIILDNDDMELSKISEKIYIINNSGWADFKSAGNCTGNGTYSDPYVIEDVVIDGGGSGSCIWIENSTVYFRIENCTLNNSGDHWKDAGIKLINTTNGVIISNNCSNNEVGIFIWESDNNFITGNNFSNWDYGIFAFYSNNNTITANFAYNHHWGGIWLEESNKTTISENIIIGGDNVGIILHDGSNHNIVSKNKLINIDGAGIGLGKNYNNTVSGNEVNYNKQDGISLIDSNNNSISENEVNYNENDGISLFRSDSNIISGNYISKNLQDGISLYESDNNSVLGNEVNYNNNGIALETSDYNNVSVNILIDNAKCIYEIDCIGNFIEKNDCRKQKTIHGYNLYLLLGIFSAVALLIRKKINSKP